MNQDILNGILGSLNTALEIHEAGARGTGRTERLLAVVRDKDVIICGTAREAERLRRQLRERRVSGVRTTHADPSQDGIMRILHHYHRTSRFLFDHTFIQAYAHAHVSRLPAIFNHIGSLNVRLAQVNERPSYNEGIL